MLNFHFNKIFCLFDVGCDGRLQVVELIEFLLSAEKVVKMELHCFSIERLAGVADEMRFDGGVTVRGACGGTMPDVDYCGVACAVGFCCAGIYPLRRYKL